MPAYALQALVLRHTKLGEADVIVTLLAEDGSQVRAVAKGMRKPTSRFAGRLQPYATVDLLLHTGKTLEVVSEARLVCSRTGLREDYERNAAAAVVMDVLSKISLEGQREERLFGLASATLDCLSDSEVERLPQLVVAFLVKALAMHGYRPELEACAACASEVGESAAFSMQAGGALCPSCGALDASSLRVPAAARRWIASLLGSTMADVARMEMPAEAIRDSFDLVAAFVAYHLPTRLKALDFYAGIVAETR
ncbi:MAG: DNA repair protein RecO [Coriobacteriales bacterium]|nr:DNA repair protein RecO [Coriobacteriales bacterium]